jgi:hypothetical protein
MKKQIIIFTMVSAFLLIVGMEIKAQTQPQTQTRTQTQVEVEVEQEEAPPAKNVRIGGIKGGYTWSNIYIDLEDVQAFNARSGFHVGLFSQVIFAETIGIQPEILFTTKGSSAKFTGIIDQRVDFNLNYIDIPLFLVYRPMDALEFHAGPYAGFLLNTNVGVDNGINGYTELKRDHFNRFDWGVGAGVQFNFRFAIVGARYHLGMQPIADSSTAKQLMGNARHSFGQVYLAFGLPRVLNP